MNGKTRNLISIGMPVYNAGPYVRHAIDSLLAQTYEQFELNIFDNASTDDTASICRHYGSTDHRVRYHRNPVNVGFHGNWRLALDAASGDFFMWAAGDDVWSANYLEALVERLLARPNAVLAAGRTVYIEKSGNPSQLEPDDAPLDAPANGLECARQLLREHAMSWLHGLYRTADLKRFAPTFFASDPWGADTIFLLRICLNAEVVGSNDAIIYTRLGSPSGPKTAIATVRWQCSLASALLRVILRSPLPARDKIAMLRCLRLYLKWLYLRKGVTRWAKLWARAGHEWLAGMSRPGPLHR